MAGDGVHADVIEVVDGRRQPDSLGDRGCACLESVGDGRPGRSVESHVADHLTATFERLQLLEGFVTPPEHPYACGAEELVRGEGKEVSAHGFDVHRAMGDELSAIDHDPGADGVRRIGDGSKSGIVPSTLDMPVTATTFTLSSMRSSVAPRSRTPFGSSGAQTTSAPVRPAIMCQGTMLAWCSIMVTSTRSPGRRRRNPHPNATELSAVVVPRVKTTWPEDLLPMNPRHRVAGVLVGLGGTEREPIGAAVHVGYLVRRNSSIASMTTAGFCADAAESRKTRRCPLLGCAKSGKSARRAERSVMPRLVTPLRNAS